MTKKGGLGRGLDSLIPTNLLDESFEISADQESKMSDMRQIKITDIVADSSQPRKNFDPESLEELADSIKEHGVLLPLVVVPAKDGNGYVIVAGERRYRASKIAGLKKVPAIVRTLSAQHKLELSLIENVQRQDLNPMEMAIAYMNLRDQFNLSLSEISKRVGNKNVSTISNTIRLLKLPEEVQKALIENKLSEGQARPLIGMDEKIVLEFLPKIIEEEWSVRKLEQFAVNLKKTKETAEEEDKVVKKIQDSPYQKELDKITKRLDAGVKIRTNAKGGGAISIKFKNDEDFKRISKLLGF